MPKDVLLEIGMEEVPARYVRGAMEQLRDKAEKWLADSRLAYDEVRVYATPRRLALWIIGLADRQEDKQEEVKGPARRIAQDEDGNWTKAALGFARSNGVDPDALVFKELGKEEYVYAKKSSQGLETAALLPEALPMLVASLHFPKPMRWGVHEVRYVRPIRWLVALHGPDIVPFEIAGVSSGRTTRGHRFLGAQIDIQLPGEYVDSLRKQHVIVDVSEREAAIKMGIQALAEQRGWQIDVKEDLLEEVLFLVETPTVLSGSFDSAFLAIPQDVLITSMREHQRYFPVLDTDGKLLPYFVTVRNGDDQSLDIVARGNEKVLRARLSDAKFFYEEDKRLSIADAMAKLEQVVYHEELGTVADKVRRVRAIAGRLAQHLRVSDEAHAAVLRAADICKFDLVTQMVYEFPELQGIMGEDYARLAGEPEAVAVAIREHYAPRHAGDEPPASLVGAIVGIADKIDTIAGCFGIGIVPTGSQDPYALRRQAAGIVATILAHRMELTVDELFEMSLETHAAGGLKRELYDVRRDLHDFFALRMKNVLSEQHIRYDIADAILAAGVGNIRRTLLRAQALQQQAANAASAADFKLTIEAFNRVCNLAAKSESESRQVDVLLFADPAEHALFEAWQQAHGSFVTAASEARMDEALAALASLSEPITAYFEAVMVMAEDAAVRHNRLATLGLIADDIQSFADFSKLVG